MLYWKQCVRLVEDDTQKQDIFIDFIDKIINFSFKYGISECDIKEVIKHMVQLVSKGRVTYEDYRNLLEYAPYLASNGVHIVIRESFILFGGMVVPHFILCMKLAIAELR